MQTLHTEALVLRAVEFGESDLILHLLTPETATSTHYFWSQSDSPNARLSADEVRAQMHRVVDLEDQWMIEGVQASMGTADLWDLKPLLLGTDAGGVRARRKLAAMIAAETRSSDGTSTELVDKALAEVSALEQ